MLTRSLLAGAVIALGSLTVATPAAAAPTPVDHASALAQICRAQGGTFVPHPSFWRARCQGVEPTLASRAGVRAASVICTGPMDGTFSWSRNDAGSISWVCL